MTQWASSTRTGKRSSVTVKKMVLATVVNYSWRGRNLRTFQNKSKHANFVWAKIIEVIIVILELTLCAVGRLIEVLLV